MIFFKMTFLETGERLHAAPLFRFLPKAKIAVFLPTVSRNTSALFYKSPKISETLFLKISVGFAYLAPIF